jgi:large subunit ribosomal protein L7/L12
MSDEKTQKQDAPVEESTEKKAEAKVEAPKEEAKAETKDVEVPAKFKTIVDAIEKMTVLDLNELVKLLEEKFGVSAVAVATTGPATGGDAAGEESSTVAIELASAGEQKIQVIKVVKEVLGLGLKEAKDFVEGAPVVLKEGVKKEEAEEIKAKLVEAGAQVNFK